MKYSLWLLVPAVILATLLACSQKQSQDTLLDPDEPPLLLEELDENGAGRPEPDGPVADNYRCHVCHMNFDGENFSTMHARANVGCEDCHGKSYAHCSDEDNITPPDVMFPKDKINDSCFECHDKDDVKEEAGHKKFYAGESDHEYCTECHATKHKVPVRTRRWNRKTGELIEDDKVRMIE